MTKGIDIKGQKFGLLTVLEEVPQAVRKDHRNRSWMVQCDCGTEPFEIIQRNLTRTGVENPKLTQSCGCIRVKAHLIATTNMGLTFEFVDSFDDFPKFVFLHKQLVRTLRKNEFVEPYQDYVNHFYYDKQFNMLYNFWIERGPREEKTYYDFFKPSVDHIIPLSRGGDNSLGNLQFLTVYENLAKRDMNMVEWNEFKKITNFGKDLMIDWGT